jgi:hypothetical protein
MFATSNTPSRGRIHCLLMTIVLGLALLARPVAADNQGGLDRGWGVDAFWLYTEGCTQTFVGIYAVAGTSVGAQVEQRDICTDTPLLTAFSGQGQMQAEDALTVNPGLSKAELHATVWVDDSVSGQGMTLYIDLVYKRVGGESDCSKSASPAPPPEGVSEVVCSAVATGTVTDGTTNYTPVPGNAVLELHRGFAG